MITFVGIIGKHDKPLYLKAFTGSLYDDAQLIEWTYAACDVFYERLQNASTAAKPQESYFGLLTAYPRVSLYGLLTNTHIKIVLAIQETELLISESMVKSVLTRIHAAYIRAVLNPFHLRRVDDNEPISSLAMDKAISHIISTWPTPAKRQPVHD
ncbi:Sedlin [Protomyces lactucae-debilis]|uniref:Sedlin n=1 Tax=Protomyces lactucae-debilis TaxID=2754530 RepID=A0A1Y2F3P4_PROLT|nr:Sedlin [Protomyces lactucae-debilis]ORY78528.1 Sedlin [Protomyces lactucae-debilis]